MNICIVSNKRGLKRNYSAFVDLCDKVMRISKMDNINSGLVGSRTDLVLVSLHPAYFKFSRANRHVDLLKLVPHVYFFPDLPRVAEQFTSEEGIEHWEFLPSGIHGKVCGFTTCGAGIYWVRHLYPDARLYFLGDVDAWQRTPSGGGGHTCSAENAFLDSLVREGRLIPILEEEADFSVGVYSTALTQQEILVQEEAFQACGSNADTEYVIEAVHPQWKDLLRILGSRADRVTGADQASVLEFNRRILSLKWDKWGTEHFLCNEEGAYCFEPGSR